jgi:ribosomal-protein-alanine N-acetyltransferase
MSEPAPLKLQSSPPPHPPLRIPTTNPKLFLRRWNPSDTAALTHAANNRKIWMNLRDKFPSPYTTADAEYYTAKAPATQVCIEYEGVAVGGIGFTVKEDIERCSAEVGYWLGE